jgi:hypothetical protein
MVGTLRFAHPTYLTNVFIYARRWFSKNSALEFSGSCAKEGPTEARSIWQLARALIETRTECLPLGGTE